MSRYRKYVIEIHVDIHDSVPVTNDPPMLNELRKDIAELASGDVVVINTRTPKRS